MGNCILGWLQIATQGAYLQCTVKDPEFGVIGLQIFLDVVLFLQFRASAEDVVGGTVERATAGAFISVMILLAPRLRLMGDEGSNSLL